MIFSFCKIFLEDIVCSSPAFLDKVKGELNSLKPGNDYHNVSSTAP